MKAAERGFLLLTSCLGNPERRPLTQSQLRILAGRVSDMTVTDPDKQLDVRDIMSIGYGQDMAQRIHALLEETDLLEHYLTRAKRAGCVPLTRVNKKYPQRILEKLGQESPGCLWARGDLTILDLPRIALAGSRDIRPENSRFAREVGVQAALQGYVLVSGNARGADRIAQAACLEHGGRVICVLADDMISKPQDDRILYLCEDDYDQPFSAERALSRNRVIHSLCKRTLIAQAELHRGGTWDGSVKNLRHGWSSIFCFQDGSEAASALIQQGAEPVKTDALSHLDKLLDSAYSLFE